MEMDRMWDKVKKGLKDGAALSMEKIEEYTKIGKLKIDEMAAKRKMDRNFADIGERVYELIKDGKGPSVEADLIVKKAIANVNALRQDLADIERKIKQVQEEARKMHQSRPVTNEDEPSGI